MIRDAMFFVGGNFPAFLFSAALLCAALGCGRERAAERLLSWILLLPVGVTGLWSALFHLIFPERTAALIGWQTSPFQYEVGMADLAIGVTACLAFQRTLGFKGATVSAASVFLLGDAVGRLHQMLIAGNFSLGNAGVPFFVDVICPPLSIILLIIAWRANQANSSLTAAMALRARL
jgi:hypothetical protein